MSFKSCIFRFVSRLLKGTKRTILGSKEKDREEGPRVVKISYEALY